MNCTFLIGAFVLRMGSSGVIIVSFFPNLVVQGVEPELQFIEDRVVMAIRLQCRIGWVQTWCCELRDLGRFLVIFILHLAECYMGLK